jgi:hypothetical protein
MKTPGSFLSIMLIGAGSLPGQALRDPALPNPVRVSTRLQVLATVEQQNVRLGEPIRVHFRTKNVSSAVLRIRNLDTAQDYGVIVTEASGLEPLLTPLGSLLRTHQSISSQGPIPLAPGAESEEAVWDLAKLFQLTKPGRYFVRILFRGVWLERDEDPHPKTVEEERKITWEEAVSDPIPFTIAP